MKKDANEKRMATQSDLKVMKKKIMKEDRKEDNKLYAKKGKKK
jgi:hypothetical protein